MKDRELRASVVSFLWTMGAIFLSLAFVYLYQVDPIPKIAAWVLIVITFIVGAFCMLFGLWLTTTKSEGKISMEKNIYQNTKILVNSIEKNKKYKYLKNMFEQIRKES